MDFPFPPVATLPADAVGRRAPLEHDAFDIVSAACLPGLGQLIPGAGGDGGRKQQSGITGILDHLLQPRAPLGEGQRAQVDAALLKQVIRHQDHGHLLQDFFAERLPADAALQLAEGQNDAVLPGQ